MQDVIWDYKEVAALGNDTKILFRECHMYLNGAFLTFNKEGAAQGERSINNALECAKLLVHNLGKQVTLPEASNFEMSEDLKAVALQIWDLLLEVEEEVFGEKAFTTREQWQATLAKVEGYSHVGKRPVKDDIKVALGIEESKQGLMQKF